MSFSPSQSAAGDSHKKKSWLRKYIPGDFPDDSSHPAQIALRTYAVSLSLSLGPALLPFLISLLSGRRKAKAQARSLTDVLKRELGPNGFAFAITVAVGGGAALQRVWQIWEDSNEQEWDDEIGSPRFDANSHNESPRAHFLERNKTYQTIRKWILSREVSSERKAFLSNIVTSTIAIILLQNTSRRRVRSQPVKVLDLPLTVSIDTATRHGPSPTLDLTLLLFVRAVDSIIQSIVFKRSERRTETYWSRSRNLSTIDIIGENGEMLFSQAGAVEAQQHREKETQWRQTMTTRIDAFIFWACSARIMWCFFYEPFRLPASYVKWINSLAKVDHRLIDTLRAIRDGNWSYIRGSPSHSHILTEMADDLGRPAVWGHPVHLPPYGGPSADKVWQQLGVTTRPGVGGFPCDIVHGGLGSSWGLGDGCTTNAGIRLALAFLQAVALYLPVHFLPVLLTRPKSLLRLHRVILPTIVSAFRSAAFLSSFVSLCWYGVCLTRTVLLARLFPFISHDFWDGPYGGMLGGSLLCGSSIWIENGRRRGEMALYVLPRAARSLLPYKWIRSGNRGVILAERIAFVLSLSTLLTAAIHRPDSLRGLSRWTIAFVMRGPNAGFWKRRKIMAQTPMAPTPRPHTPAVTDMPTIDRNHET